MFGDNKAMVDSATYPFARIHKRHRECTEKQRAGGGAERDREGNKKTF